jgi:hypothetical protein
VNVLRALMARLCDASINFIIPSQPHSTYLKVLG